MIKHLWAVTAFLLCTILWMACREEKRQPASATTVTPVVNETENALSRLVDMEARYTTDSLKRQLQQLAPHVRDYRSRALYNYLLGNRYLNNKEADSATACYQRMLTGVLPDTARDMELILLQKAGLLRTSMDTAIDDQTFERLHAIIKLAEQHKAPHIWRVYNLAAETYFRYGDTARPEYYTRRSMATWPDSADIYQWSVYMERLSRAQEIKDNIELAMVYEDSALYYANQIQDKKRLATVYAAKGVLYLRAHQFEEGHKWTDSGFALKQQINELTYNDWLNKGMTFTEKGTPGKAIPYLQNALEIARKQRNHNLLNKAYGTIYEAYWQLGDYKHAARYMDSSGNAAMKAMYQQQYKQVARLQAVNDLKEEQLKTVALNKENENKALQLRQQKWLMIVFGGLLLVAAGIAYLLVERRNLRTRQKHIELEQQLLRSQMEPHFIFNTLSVLQSYIRNHEPEKAVKYLNQFARLLRLNLENSRENLVELKDEVEALENYLSLQAMRFEGTFDYTVNVFEGYEEEDICIPPMLLQPFVENAIQHGMRNLDYKGHIHVQIQLKGKALHCTIEDNGTGLQPGIAPIGKRSLSGIITQERLALLSRQTHQPATLVITDKNEQGQRGLKVEMVIPVRKRTL